MKKVTIHIYFDGECFFCQHFSSWVKLKDQADLTLHDLREPEVASLSELAEFNLDSGFIIKIDKQLFQWEKGLQELDAYLKRGFTQKLFTSFVNIPIVRPVGYAIIKFLRKCLLKIQWKSSL